MTVLKDVRTLAADAITAANAFLAGQTPEKTNTYNNGKIDVPAKPSAIVTVTKDNVKAGADRLGLLSSERLHRPAVVGFSRGMQESHDIILMTWDFCNV